MSKHGGRREGAGRPAGARNRVKSVFLPPEGPRSAAAAEFLAALVADERHPVEVRLQAAKALLPYTLVKPGERRRPEDVAADAMAKASVYAVPPSPPGPHLRAVGGDE